MSKHRKKTEQQHGPVPAEPHHHVHLPGGECCHEDAEAERMMADLEADPLGAERAMRDLRHMLKSRDFATMEEFEAFANSVDAATTERARAERLSDPKERAHDLALTAFETEAATEAQRLAGEALALDPHCLDALVVKIQGHAEMTEADLQMLEAAIDVNMKTLPEFGDDDPLAGLEAQPLLRAHMVAGEMNRAHGNFENAQAHFIEALRFSSDDPQAAALLLGCALATGDIGTADAVAEDFAESGWAVFAWGHVLARHLAGESAAASAALKKARRMNRHVEEYLAMRKPLGDLHVDEFAPGSDEEARTILYAIGPAWLAHPPAMEWLAKQLQADGKRK